MPLIWIIFMRRAYRITRWKYKRMMKICSKYFMQNAMQKTERNFDKFTAALMQQKVHYPDFNDEFITSYHTTCHRIKYDMKI